METDRFQRLSVIFERAVALPSGERAALLDQECNGDSDLRTELENLLKHAEGPDDPVVTAAGLDALFEEAGLRPRSDHVSIPDVIGGNSHHTPAGMGGTLSGGGPGVPMPLLTGQYRIVRVIGEGGMGIVYEAEQAFPKRRVALKSIRPGMFSRRMLRRFQNEAHILGRLHHPGIAQIYEAGASDPQRPDDAFFVMEFVDGPPLTLYADNHKLGTRQRVELMIKVCDAVQHAHQRGVIHRDLKPANILVTNAEGEAEPKILDFGVARVTDDDTLADSMHTRAGQLVGTLAYMSPEQISSGTSAGGGADTRADIYALGVTMYQLLAGRLPHDLADKSIPDAAQIVRDQEPSKLGTLDRTYRGDLETIVAKAMDKNRDRRYQSASELGADLQRYLSGEAIAAKRDSAMYVLRKQIRRNKGAVAAGVVIFVGLVAFGVVSAMQARANRGLADELADQLTIANCEKGRLLTLAGDPSLGERALWMEYLQRPDMIEPYWALWEYYARQPIVRTTGGPGLQPGRIAITPDRSTVFWLGREGEMQAWTSDLKKCLWKTSSAAGEVQIVAMYPDGKTAACYGAAAAKLFLVDIATGVARAFTDAPAQRPNAMTPTPDGRNLLVGDIGGNIVMLDAADLSQVRKFPVPGQAVSSMSIAPDNNTLVVSGTRGTYAVWDMEQARVIGNLPIKSASALRTVFSPDGEMLYALSSDGVIHSFHTSDWSAGPKITTGDTESRQMVLMDDGVMLTSGTGGLRFWNLKTQEMVGRLPGDEGGVYGITPGPTPGTFLTCGMGTAVRLWERAPFDCAQVLPIQTKDWMLGIEPDREGRWLVVADGGGIVRVFDARTREPLGQVQGPGTGGRSLVWKPKSDAAAVAYRNGEVVLLDISAAGPRIASSWRAHEAPAVACDYSPDGERIATGSETGEIKIWSTQTWTLLYSVASEHTGITSLCFSPDGQTLAATGIGPGVALYDVAEDRRGGGDAPGRMIASIPDKYRNWRAKFSPDGGILAVGRSRSEIELLDPRTLKVRQTLRGHTSSVTSLAFSPAGDLLVTSSGDHTLRLWNLKTGRTLLALDAGRQVSCVSFLPGARSIASSGQGGWAAVWDLSRYDGHIAGSLSYHTARLSPALARPARAHEILSWARRATGDATLNLDDPTIGAKVVPVTPVPGAGGGEGVKPTVPEQ